MYLGSYHDEQAVPQPPHQPCGRLPAYVYARLLDFPVNQLASLISCLLPENVQAVISTGVVLPVKPFEGKDQAAWFYSDYDQEAVWRYVAAVVAVTGSERPLATSQAGEKRSYPQCKNAWEPAVAMVYDVCCTGTSKVRDSRFDCAERSV